MKRIRWDSHSVSRLQKFCHPLYVHLHTTTNHVKRLVLLWVHVKRTLRTLVEHQYFSAIQIVVHDPALFTPNFWYDLDHRNNHNAKTMHGAVAIDQIAKIVVIATQSIV